jgi:hypothetical protein
LGGPVRQEQPSLRQSDSESRLSRGVDLMTPVHQKTGPEIRLERNHNRLQCNKLHRQPTPEGDAQIGSRKGPIAAAYREVGAAEDGKKHNYHH